MPLAIGMLVDNLVVISRHLSATGKCTGQTDRGDAGRRPRVGVATLAGTLCTTIVFLPLVFGERNQMSIFLVHVAVPIVVAMTASLLVAQTLIPMLAAHDSARRRSPPDPGSTGCSRATSVRSTGRSGIRRRWRW